MRFTGQIFTDRSWGLPHFLLELMFHLILELLYHYDLSQAPKKNIHVFV